MPVAAPRRWKTLIIMTATLFPAVIFSIFFVLNLVLWHNESSAALPFGTMFALLVLWFCVSTPLCFLGAYLGFKKPQIGHPVNYDDQPRAIPDQPMYTRPVPGILMGGILPFGCVFIQLFFILNSIWCVCAGLGCTASRSSFLSGATSSTTSLALWALCLSYCV